MKKILFVAMLVTVIVTRCSKDKCEGCEVSTKIYLDDVLQWEGTSNTDCGATPGTTVKRANMAFGKVQTTFTTVKCY